ncbi:MAG: hypothetical protein AAGE01_18155 [Pseudomonadota bacterium]
MKPITMLTGTVAAFAMLATSGCATTDPQQYRLQCRGTSASQFEECGNVFDTFTECKAAQQRMVRTPGLRAKDRGTCLKGHDR